MSAPFHRQILVSLDNPALRAALDANAERRVKAWLDSMATLPGGGEAMRRRAHEVRAETIANLDIYLEQFVDKAQTNGLVVHRAADAAQAVRIVLEIARQNRAKLIAKAKSMLSEEIGLNHALAQAGLTVVETDLGEFIVQLRGERPAHILTPAVHLRRQQVGQTFHEKLGIPLTDDIPTLVAAARQTLRQTFLEADIGVSGVNFGVAESGTVCLVTNEGNGRMVTTLPAVHVALMGIERLVPTLDDLALMLTLLPRAASGLKTTVYTTLIHGPSTAFRTGPGRSGDPDGPRERHLILVDNGREALRRSLLAEALLCIRCGACLNACPVFREIGGHAYVDNQGEASPYSGPIGSVISPGLFGQEAFGHLARASSLCGACKEACPVDIDLPRLLLRVRAGGVRLETRRARMKIPMAVNLGLRLFTWFATDARRFRMAQRLVGGLGSLLLLPWVRLPANTGWGYSKDFPRPAERPFREIWAAQRRNGQSPEAILSDNATDTLPIEGNAAADGSLRIPSRPAPSAVPSGSNIVLRELVNRFSSELLALGGTCTLCEGEDLASYLLDFLRDKGIPGLMSWDADQLPPGMIERVKEAGIRISYVPDPAMRAGLTGALGAIADTGTLVLTSGPGRYLFTSLLPEIHIAVLRARDIYADLPQILRLREVKEASTVALISGPSRTADIEMTLTVGAHGPREVHVFCYSSD